MDSNASSPSTPPEPQDDVDALETPEEGSVVANNQAAAQKASEDKGAGGSGAPEPKKPGGIRALIKRLNLYLLIFVFILVLAGVIIGVAYFQGKAANNTTVKAQNLTQNTLSQLANSDASVGDPKQVLNVESNAVFAGKVLISQGLEVAGGFQVSGTVTLEGVTISGDTQLQQVEVGKNLSVTGNAGIQGQVTVGQSLQVNGTGTFNGALSAPSVTTTTLQLNGDLTLTHHIIAGGPSPTETSGSAMGAGGTAGFNGSDTSGSITINTGSGPTAGCFITINFANKYTATPRVLVTPVGASAAGIPYYVNRTSSSFSLCDASAAPPGTSFGFDYFVVD